MTAQTLAPFAVGAAGLAFGLVVTVIALYARRIFVQGGVRRLLPLHVVGIGVSYGMLAAVGVLRLGAPRADTPGWLYAVLLTAFLIGDAALVSIALLLGRAGPRYRIHGERRDDY